MTTARCEFAVYVVDAKGRLYVPRNTLSRDFAQQFYALSLAGVCVPLGHRALAVELRDLRTGETIAYHQFPPPREGAREGATPTSLTRCSEPTVARDAAAAHHIRRGSGPRLSLLLTPLAVLVCGLVLAATAVLDSIRRSP